MKLFNILAILITLSAVFSYINHRYTRLPNTIGLMLIALLVSLGMIILGKMGFGLEQDARKLLDSIDFNETLTQRPVPGNYSCRYLLYCYFFDSGTGTHHRQTRTGCRPQNIVVQRKKLVPWQDNS